jgi:membrane dipeptidase
MASENYGPMKTRYQGLILMTILVLTGSGVLIRNGRKEVTMEEVKKIHHKALTLDSHTDTPFFLTDEGFDFSGRNGNKGFRNCVDLTKMQEGGLDAVFLAVFVGQGPRNDSMNAAVRARAFTQFDTIRNAVARYPDMARLALTPDDAYQNQKKGLRSIYIGIENGYVLGNDITLVNEYYNRGARYITLCHSKNNDICDSSSDEKGPEHDGLSDFGKTVVEEMNRVGMMVDISHASDKSFYDILEVTKAPVIASHSDCRALCEMKRNLTDDMLVKLSENGGVIQICFLSAYVKKMDDNIQRDSAMAVWHTKYPDYGALSPAEQKIAGKEWDDIDERFPSPKATVSDMVDHIDHAVKIAGIDHVGIGTDFDGGGGLSDCQDVSMMENVTAELVRRGYTEEEIIKIWGGNFMRVFREVNKVSEKMQ